jgi:hypothetical protein
MAFTLTDILSEVSASEQAKQLGLVYGGFGGWIDPESRKVVARTVDGKLVRIENDDENNGKPDLGRLSILSFEDTVAHSDLDHPSIYLKKFNIMLNLIIRRGGHFVMLVNRGSERAIADYLRRSGIKAGVSLVTIGEANPSKIRDFIKEKIKEGYTNIQFFDTDEKDVNAVESLKATLNKMQNLVIKTHLFTKMDRNDVYNDNDANDQYTNMKRVA